MSQIMNIQDLDSNNTVMFRRDEQSNLNKHYSFNRI